MSFSNARTLLVLLFTLSFPAAALELTGSGFLTLGAGKVTGGQNNDAANRFGYAGPSVVTDYANKGVYEAGNGVSLAPDTKLGLQGTARFSPGFALTAQAVARGAQDGRVNLEWLYGDFSLDERTTLQIGRKRLPLFYHSETQDVGLTYPWTHLPQGLYGWEVVNYDGANLIRRERWGDLAATINLFAGGETREKNPFWEIYQGKGQRVDSRWSRLYGAELGLNGDVIEGRFVYISSGIQNRNVSAGSNGYLPASAPRQHIYGLALNADIDHWVLRSEAYYMDRKEADEQDFGQMLGVGYRFGDWLPMVTCTNYRQALAAPTYNPNNSERYMNLVWSLRWDVTASSALKLQYERWLDRSRPGYRSTTPFAGANLVSVSYDRVF